MAWHSSRLAFLGSCLVFLRVGFVTALEVVRHDKTWQPTYVLEATAQNITVACKTRYSTVFNGSFPGPTLYLKEGETTWVRVYNNIEDANITVVRMPYSHSYLDPWRAG
jgi:L-ascorbate oxidase